MNHRDYRLSRVKVTKDIKDKLLELLMKEGDVERKKKHPASWYQAEVAKELKLADENNPSLRSYEKEIQPLRKALQTKDPLDEPWSIGACVEQKIYLSTEDIFHILQVRQKQLKDENLATQLSIRQALWMARLYAVAQHTSETEDQALERLWTYSFQYAIWEKVCNLKRDDFHTREIDDVLLEGFEKFKEFCENRVFSNLDDYKNFYLSHNLAFEKSK